MRKIVVLMFVLAMTLFAGVKEDIESIDIIAKNNIKVKKFMDIGSFYVVNGEANVRGKKQVANFFVSKDKEAVIFGKGFMANGEEIVIPVDIKKYEGQEAFKIGSGKNKYFVFTDPECPYCIKFEKMIKEKNLLKNNTFYFFLYPLSFHKQAVPMSLFILSKDSDKAKWEAMENVEDKYKKVSLSKEEVDKLQGELDKQMAIANELGIRGTPAVFDINGKQVDWTGLE